jgi:hypothetical protein
VTRDGSMTSIHSMSKFGRVCLVQHSTCPVMKLSGFQGKSVLSARTVY